MSEPRFSSAAVIGSGMMGPGIALILALGKVKTTILSRTEQGAAQGLEAARGLGAILADNELAEPAEVDAALTRIDSSVAFEETVSRVDLVIESAPEDMEFKQKLFARMDGLTDPHVILASNTSSLSVTAIASLCKYPERVLTTHFWNPPYLIPLVEIVRGEKTSGEAAEAIRDLLLICGKTPVVVQKDRPGQLGNRLQAALMREAAYMIGEGIASAGDIDTAMKRGLGLRYPAYGLLEHMDMVGTDLALTISDYVSKDLYNEPRAPEYLRELVRRGELGARTGKGFHDWSERSPENVKQKRDRFLIDFLRAERKAAKQTGH